MSNKQKEELAKYCLDVSKLALASWIFVIFSGKFGLPELILLAGGLTIALISLRLGMNLLKRRLYDCR